MKRQLIILLVTIFTGLSISSCSTPPQGSGNAGMPGGMPPGLPVEIETIQTQKLHETEDYVALLTSKHSTDIYPKISGYVETINVNDGDYVRKGDVLISIQLDEPLARLKSSEAATHSALNDLKVAEANLEAIIAEKQSSIAEFELQQKEYKRYYNLYQEDSVTKSNLDQVTAALQKSEANLNSIEKKIQAQKMLVMAKKASYQQSKEQMNETRINFDYFKISAPFDGFVGDIPVKIGEYVTPQSPVTSLTGSHSLEVNIPVEYAKLAKLKKGMRVDILNDQKESVYKTELYFVSPKVNTDTQTILAKALIDNSSNSFKVDQQVKTRLYYDTFDGISIPTTAMIHFAGKDFVYILQEQDGKNFAKMIPILLGQIYGNRYVVKSGLEPNQRIITSGVQKLSDGTPVLIMDNGKKQ
jgi:multidrug resistance efflux pump